MTCSSSTPPLSSSTWVRKCRTKEREEEVAQSQSGQTAETDSSTSTSKPEDKPAGSYNAVFIDDDSDVDGFRVVRRLTRTSTALSQIL